MSFPFLLIRTIGLILTLIFLFHIGRRDNRLRILALFFLTVSLSAFFGNIYMGQNFLRLSIISSHFSATTLLPVVLAFLYVSLNIENRPLSLQKDGWHFLPSLFIFIGQLPYITSSWEHKQAIVQKIQSLQIDRNAHVLNSFVTPLQYQLLFVIQVFIYLFLIWKKMAPIYRQGETASTTIEANRATWLKWFTGVFTFNCLMSVGMAAFKFSRFEALFPVTIITQIREIGSMSYIFLTAVILFAPFFSRTAATTISTELQKKGSSAEQTSKRFSSDYVQTIEEKLNLYVASKKFLDADSKITEVAEYTGIPLHHLSAYFNQHLCTSFPDWRNNLRIIEAKQLISNGLGDELNMEGIAQRVGFTNRSTFSVVFRKHAGLSPTEFSRTHPALEFPDPTQKTA